MKFTSKDYIALKTKNYIKTSNLFFFFSGINQDANDLLQTEQSLKMANFCSYKVFNKIANKTLKDSLFDSIKPTINGATFLIKPAMNSYLVRKQTLTSNFKPLLFTLLAIKLNNKIYSIEQLKDISSLEYEQNKLLLHQFGLANLKIYL